MAEERTRRTRERLIIAGGSLLCKLVIEGLQATFLGTATSVGVPMVNCDCATCTSDDPRDKRLRASLWVRTETTSVVIDTGPDFRQQCLRAGIRRLDAVLFTHAHYDHVAGFDEVRRFTVGLDERMPVHARKSTIQALERMFPYAFDGENVYRGYLKPEPHEVTGPVTVGDITFTPLPVRHGKVETVGWLIGWGGRDRLAYVPDCKQMPDSTLAMIRSVDTLILDALRRTPHLTHLTFDEALELSGRIGARETWFTHFQCEIRHAIDEPNLPPGVRLAYDGLTLRWRRDEETVADATVLSGTANVSQQAQAATE